MCCLFLSLTAPCPNNFFTHLQSAAEFDTRIEVLELLSTDGYNENKLPNIFC